VRTLGHIPAPQTGIRSWHDSEVTNPCIDRFDRTAEGYLRWWAPMLAPCASRLVDRIEHLDAGLAGGKHRDVIDVGCGTGSETFEAVVRWPGARLTGLDGSIGMLDVARREGNRLAESARARIAYVQSDAATIPFPAASFDVVMTAFVLQQVPDRIAVVREFHRILRPGSILGIYGWIKASVPFAPDLELEEALAEAGIVRPPAVEVRAGHYRTVRSAADELRTTGFTRVSAELDALDHRWRVEDYIGYQTTARELTLFESLDDATRSRGIEALRRRLNALDSDQLVNRAPIVSMVARKA
jgi:ubiquinone/menaquinone biosynthesis C-methylase UbiE